MHELQHGKLETGAVPTQKLPRGISWVSAKQRYRVKLRRQKKDYWGGEYLTQAEALAALADLHRILKDTPELKRGPKGYAYTRKPRTVAA